MKALVFTQYGSPEKLQLQQVDIPKPNENEVLIKVYSVSINDWDWGLIRGEPFVNRLIGGLCKPKINIPGVDIAGKIDSIGKNISRFQPGDEVYGDLSVSGFGDFAEYVCAKENAITKKPAGMTFNQAAAIPHSVILTLQGLFDKGQFLKKTKKS